MEDGSHGLTLLREKLDDPHASEVVARLIDRIDALESTVNRMADLVEQAPLAIATVTDMADESIERAASRGVDVDVRLRSALALVERMTEPKMVEALNRLMDLAEGSEGMLATLGDVVDEAARHLDADGRVQAGSALLERATRPTVAARLTEMFDTLLAAEHGMLSPPAVDTIGAAAQALVEARNRPPRRVTVWQAFRAARDPQLQRALGFLLDFGELFADRLDS